jgi:hypothetical protein
MKNFFSNFMILCSNYSFYVQNYAFTMTLIISVNQVGRRADVHNIQ